MAKSRKTIKKTTTTSAVKPAVKPAVKKAAKPAAKPAVKKAVKSPAKKATGVKRGSKAVKAPAQLKVSKATKVPKTARAKAGEYPLTKKQCMDIIKVVKTRTRTLSSFFPETGLTWNSWRRMLKAYSIDIILPRGRELTTYTPEVRQKILALVAKGEYLSYACRDVGVDYINYLRWCRRQGIAGQPVSHRNRNNKRRRSEQKDRVGPLMKQKWASGAIKRDAITSDTPKGKRIAKMLRNGDSYAKVRRTVGCTLYYVKRIEREQNISH